MSRKLKVVALVSGGKDSCYSMLQCVAAGHEIVALANLRPHDQSKNELDSYMYQTVGHQAIDYYAEAMDKPLFRGFIRGSSLNQSSEYKETQDDEVEDLVDLLESIKSKVDFDAVCSGAILSDYQRVRVENVCVRLGLVSLAFLWRRDQAELLDEMVSNQVNSILIKVAALGLNPKHLGQDLSQVRDHLHLMNSKYGLNICGEGGEYETFTLDCPLFVKKLVVCESEIKMHSDDAFAPVAFLQLKKLKLEDKPNISNFEFLRSPLDFVKDEEEADESSCEKAEDDSMEESEVEVPDSNGWFMLSNLLSTAKDPEEAMHQILLQLKDLLAKENRKMEYLVAVTLLVPRMEDFARFNKVYISYFGSNPPIRVCVENSERQKCRLTAIGNEENSQGTMHVQSISHWAPANIGPYSQVTKVNGLLHIAGQIGLIPGSMELSDTMESQARLGLRHLKRILQVYSLGLGNIVQLICYVTSEDCIPLVERLWKKQFPTPETSQEMLSVVIVPNLPKNAQSEWHAIAAERCYETKVTEEEDTKIVTRSSELYEFTCKKMTAFKARDNKGEKAIKRTRYVVPESSHFQAASEDAENVEIFPILGFADKSLVCIEYSMTLKV